MTRTRLFLLPLMLTACAPQVMPLPDDACGAGGYQNLVGRHSSAFTLPGGPEFRHYKTGDPVTLDYNPSRVNFEYDDKGYLIGVNCG